MDKLKKATFKMLSIVGLTIGVILVVAGPDVLLAINEMMKKPEDKSLRLDIILLFVLLFIIFFAMITINEFKKSKKKSKKTWTRFDFSLDRGLIPVQ